MIMHLPYTNYFCHMTFPCDFSSMNPSILDNLEIQYYADFSDKFFFVDRLSNWLHMTIANNEWNLYSTCYLREIYLRPIDSESKGPVMRNTFLRHDIIIIWYNRSPSFWSLIRAPWAHLTHWGRVTHICVSKITIISSDNGLSPDRRQAIIFTYAGILLIGQTSVKILSEFKHFRSTKCT